MPATAVLRFLIPALLSIHGDAAQAMTSDFQSAQNNNAENKLMRREPKEEAIATKSGTTLEDITKNDQMKGSPNRVSGGLWPDWSSQKTEDPILREPKHQKVASFVDNATFAPCRGKLKGECLFEGRQVLPACGWKTFSDSTTLRYNEWDSESWGNLLSEYWNARGLAALAGLDYSGGSGMSQSFLKYLPHSKPRLPEFFNESLYKRVCEICGNTMFPHSCAGAWVHIRKLIQEDTHAAMRHYEAASKYESAHNHIVNLPRDSSFVEPADKREDVLVHLRLEFDHPKMGWPGMSVFRSRLPRNVSKIMIMHQPLTKGEVDTARAKGNIHQTYSQKTAHEARILLDGYRALLKKECSGCPVEFQTGGQYEDFALIARNNGPVFCSLSSYCLWAGLANKHGPVYMPNSPVKQIHGGQGQGFFRYTEGFLLNAEIQSFEKMSAAQVVDWVSKN